MEKAEIRSRYMLAGLLLIAFALPFAVGYATEGVSYDADWFVNLAQVILNGLLQGGVYSMYAVGLTLIFGVMRIINVAHGELVMVGAYLTYTFFTYLGWDPLLSMALTLPIVFSFGMVIQKLLLNAVVGGPELTPLLVTFGLGLSVIHIVEAIYTTDFRTIPYAQGTIPITENLALPQPRVVSFLMALFISLGVFAFLKMHRLGKAIRATAQNRDVAMVCGINIYRVYVVTYGLGAALAAAGGALVSIQFGFNPETGVFYTIQAFAIIILGGRGHYIGALIGGFMLAILEGLVSFLVPHGTDMVEIAAYSLIIFVLLIRPQGLLGLKEG